MIFACINVENFMEKEVKANSQPFLLFPQWYQIFFFQGHLTLSQTSPDFYVSAV